MQMTGNTLTEKIRQERKDKLHRFGGSVYNPTYKDDRPIGKLQFSKILPWYPNQ